MTPGQGGSGPGNSGGGPPKDVPAPPHAGGPPGHVERDGDRVHVGPVDSDADYVADAQALVDEGALDGKPGLKVLYYLLLAILDRL
ncbi:hypothetical protein J2752_000475 [Halarchaeum rubridurum]|uniref:Uncharacterized protein n=1 Tax=Halarchaeum rubridurum TaxID=489911 RepID=A0A830FV58_9EURY|nr:hypothetical protein [Halarchaeum rubridurum]MBP1953594.1 hypothetical protein [Halarchaeum rubridurum]GGM64097.1 hypothetical protein GCM10009017_12690 [Halarchaeum rubridurum]